MPFDGSGNYVPAAAPNFPAVGGQTISSSYYNSVINDIVTALNNCVTRDNQGKFTANVDFNGKNASNIAVFSCTGNGTIGGNLTVTGNTTVNGTFSTSGSVTLGSNTGGITSLFLNAAAGNTRGLGWQIAGVYAADISLITDNTIQYSAPSTHKFICNGTVEFTFGTNGTLIASNGGFLASGTVNTYNAGFSHTRAGAAGYHLYNQGAVCEWLILQPAHATDDSLHFATGIAGTLTDRLVISPTGTITATGNLSLSGTLTSGTAPNCIGFLGVPSTVKTANYTLAAGDIGQAIDMNGTTLTLTVPTGLPNGYTVMVSNLNASALTITSAGDTIYLSGTTTTGNRTIGQNGQVTLRRTNGIWIIGGSALS